jgi:pimeloyl-ACP methyl ester carboxylesterase
VDLPGFGLTGPTPDGDYSLPMYTRFVTSVLDRVGVQRAALAGNSFGGYVAWKVAVDAPERVSRLILVDASGYAYQSQSIPIGFRLAQMPALKPLMINLLPRRMIESSLANVYGDPAKITPELIDRYFELTLRAGNRAAVIERFAQSKGGLFENQVKSIRQPTLILWGSEDRLIPPENAAHFQRDIAGSKLVMLEGLGHVPQEEDPVTTVAAAQTFLADWTPTAER